MPTTLKQARNRMNSGHLRALRLVRDTGALAVGPGEPVSSARGLATAAQTAIRWGAIEVVSPGRYSPNGSTQTTYRLTDFGRELLAAC